MTNNYESIGLRGHLVVTRVDLSGDRAVLFDASNHIVTGALTTFSEIIAQKAGVDPVERAIHSLWIESSAVALAPVSVSDTGPAGTVIKRAVFDRAADVDTNVGAVQGLTEFRATLAASEGNGTTVRAVNLFTRGDDDDPLLSTTLRLFARQIVGAIPKDSTFALDFTWTIQLITI